MRAHRAPPAKGQRGKSPRRQISPRAGAQGGQRARSSKRAWGGVAKRTACRTVACRVACRLRSGCATVHASLRAVSMRSPRACRAFACALNRMVGFPNALPYAMAKGSGK